MPVFIENISHWWADECQCSSLSPKQCVNHQTSESCLHLYSLLKVLHQTLQIRSSYLINFISGYGKIRIKPLIPRIENIESF